MDNADGCRYICMTGSVDKLANMYASTNTTLKNAGERKAEERKYTVEVVDVEPNSNMETYVLSVVNALTLKDEDMLLGIT